MAWDGEGGVCGDMSNVYGLDGAGTVPITAQNSEWEKETGKKLDAWPREAAGPVVMNPISRQNYHKA